MAAPVANKAAQVFQHKLALFIVKQAYMPKDGTLTLTDTEIKDALRVVGEEQRWEWVVA